MTWQPTLNRIGAGPNGKGFQAQGFLGTALAYQDAAQAHRPSRANHHVSTLRKHHGKMVELTRLLSSAAAAWFRENDCFEQVYPVERIVLAPSLPRVDEISAS